MNRREALVGCGAMLSGGLALGEINAFCGEDDFFTPIDPRLSNGLPASKLNYREFGVLYTGALCLSRDYGNALFWREDSICFSEFSDNNGVSLWVGRLKHGFLIHIPDFCKVGIESSDFTFGFGERYSKASLASQKCVPLGKKIKIPTSGEFSSFADGSFYRVKTWEDSQNDPIVVECVNDLKQYVNEMVELDEKYGGHIYQGLPDMHSVMSALMITDSQNNHFMCPNWKSLRDELLLP